MKPTLILVALLIITGCCSKNDSGLFYVIKEQKIPKNSFLIFYRTHNLILFNDTTIYYHSVNPYFGMRCGTGLDFSKPSFLDLTPNSLKKIDLKELPFYWKKWSENKREMRVIIVSSPKDTIRNPALLKLKQLSDFNKKVRIGVHKCTEEQLYVSIAKFENKSYDSKKINWKTGFDDRYLSPESSVLPFLPPSENQ